MTPTYIASPLKNPSAWGYPGGRALAAFLLVSAFQIPLKPTAEDLELAELALVALWADAVGDVATAVHRDKVVLLPDPEVLTAQKAAEHLAFLPKPIRCDGRFQDNRLFVECQQLVSLSAAEPAEDEASFTRYREEWLRSQAEYWAAYLGKTGEPQLFHVRGREESRLVPFPLMLRWWQDYELGGARGTVDRPDTEARSHGAGALVTFGPRPIVRDIDSLEFDNY